MTRPRLVWWLALRLLLVGVFAGLGLLLLGLPHQREAALEQRQRELARLAPVLADALREQAGPPARHPDLDEQVRRLGRLAQARVLIVAPTGEIWADSQGASGGRLPPGDSPDLAQAARSGSGSNQDTDAAGRPILNAAVAIRGDQQLQAFLRVSQPLPATGELLAQQAATLWPGWVFLALLLSGAAWLLAERLSEPLREFMHAIRRLHAQGAAPAVPRTGVFEAQRLATAFNLMSRRATAQLQRQQRQTEHWQALFASLREGLFSVDQHDALLTMNRAAGEDLGVKNPDHVEGRPLIELVRNADLQDFLRDLRASPDRHLERELTLATGNGHDRHFLVSGTLFPHPAPPLFGALVLLKDISRLRHLEKMREEFVANVSHELKTPLTTIRGYAETIQDCLRDDPESAARFLDTIRRQSERLNAIVDDLLYLSRLEQGDTQLLQDFGDGDIAATIRHAAATCDDKAQEKHIAVVLDGAPMQLHANHQLLETAVANLLGNALKYSPERSSVRVGWRPVGEQLEISVQDHGIGIAPEHHKLIFRRFYRVDKSRDRRSGGTGLGLSIVKHIARVHDGWVSVDSALGHGSTFTLRLPLTPGGSRPHHA